MSLSDRYNRGEGRLQALDRYLGLLLGLNPILIVMTPLAIMLGVALWLLRRAN